MGLFSGLIKKLQGEELRREKEKDFRNVVLLQIGIIFSALLLKETFELFGFNETYKLRDSIFLGLGGFYVLVLWDLLRNFTVYKPLIYSLFFLILGTYLLAIVAVNPFIKFFTPEEERPYLFFIHSVLFIIEMIVIYFSILDIFSGEKLSPQKLWGAACIYLMIAIGFGSAYDLICIASIGALGTHLQLGMESYTSCIYHSLTILGGQDSVFDNQIRLIRNLGVIEALWGNLFIVLLVGRLLSKSN